MIPANANSGEEERTVLCVSAAEQPIETLQESMDRDVEDGGGEKSKMEAVDWVVKYMEQNRERGLWVYRSGHTVD